MTGKIQKQINDAEKLKEACSLSLEERAQLIDEAILEIHSKNGDFLEAFKMPINSFRGMYQVYVLFRQVDELMKKLHVVQNNSDWNRKQLNVKRYSVNVKKLFKLCG